MASFSRFIQPDFGSESIHQSFYPFTRFNHPWNAYQTFKLILLSFTVLPIRIIGYFISLLCCYSICYLINVSNNDTLSRLPISKWKIFLYRLLPKFGWISSFLFGFYNVKVKHLTYKQMEDLYGYRNKRIPKNQRCCIIVSNHISINDAPLFMYLFNSSFIAKYGVKTAPFIGTISKCINCLFVKSLGFHALFVFY